MSNPSGPDPDATQEPDETPEPAEESPEPAEDTSEQAEGSEESPESEESPQPEFESAEPTEVLSGPDEQPDDDPTQRRYSAPSGFDVRSTEIIHTPPEPATDVIATSPTHPGRPATPQAIPPRPGALRHRSWALVLVLIAVIAALAVIAVLGTVWLTRKGSPTVSQEDRVRQTIHEFDRAIQKGDLGRLRGITCGSLRQSYVDYADNDWATIHKRVAAAKQYPMVASIDQVVVNGEHAEANVTTFMAYAPQVRSTRSFDLRFLDGRWKICQGPMTTPP